MTATEKTRNNNEKCPCHGLTLERFVRPAVLMILAEGDQYGYRIVQQLAGMPIFGGQKPNAAGVYRCLRLMAAEGSVVSSWELSARGPAKRQYKLTAEGTRCLATWIETLRDYRQALDGLLGLGQEILRKKGSPPPRPPCCCDSSCDPG